MIREASRPLADSLGLLPRRVGDHWEVPSRTRSGLWHRVDRAVDGTLLCRCEDSFFNRNQDCYHCREVRKEQPVTATEQSTDIVPIQFRQPTSLIPSDGELNRMDRVARIVLAGGIDLPRELNTPEKVMGVMLRGRALGIDPMIAIAHISVIEGGYVPDAELMAALLERDQGAHLEVIELTEARCTMRIRWADSTRSLPYTVTVEDHDVATLIKRDTPHQARSRDGGTYQTKEGGWVSYRKDHLRAHCAKRLMRINAPGTINGLASYGFRTGETDEERIDEPETVEFPSGPVSTADVDKDTGEVTAINPGPFIDDSDGRVIGTDGEPEEDRPAYDDDDADFIEVEEVRAKTPAELLAQVRASFAEIQQSWDRASFHLLVNSLRAHYPEMVDGAGLRFGRCKNLPELAIGLAAALRESSVPA